jgi:glycine dehydrogenase subunit 1
MALAASVYMATMGKHGMRKVAELNYHKAHYAADQIDKIQGFKVSREKPFFNEFMVKTLKPVSEITRCSFKRALSVAMT